MIGTLRREVFDRLLIINEHHLREVLTEYPLHYNAAPAAPCPRPAHASPSRHSATRADQPRRAPDPPKTSPRRTYARVPDRRMTGPRCHEKKHITTTIEYSNPTGCCEKEQVTATIVYSSPTRQRTKPAGGDLRQNGGAARLGPSPV